MLIKHIIAPDYQQLQYILVHSLTYGAKQGQSKTDNFNTVSKRTLADQPAAAMSLSNPSWGSEAHSSE